MTLYMSRVWVDLVCIVAFKVHVGWTDEQGSLITHFCLNARMMHSLQTNMGDWLIVSTMWANHQVGFPMDRPPRKHLTNGMILAFPMVAHIRLAVEPCPIIMMNGKESMHYIYRHNHLCTQLSTRVEGANCPCQIYHKSKREQGM